MINMISDLLNIDISKLIICDLLFAFINGGLAKSGNRDAFYYNKSKSLVKKQIKQLNIIQRVFWLYPSEYTKTLKFRNVFYVIRLVNVFFVFLYMCLFIISKLGYLNSNVVLAFIIIRAFIINGTLLVLCIFSELKGKPQKGNRKMWNFD